jgi:hypothetical protein
MLPDDATIIYGSVLMVNNKPQGMMWNFPCKKATKTYNIPPEFLKIEIFRDEIITAAAGNVDIQ